jgi:hypothetical protein
MGTNGTVTAKFEPVALKEQDFSGILSRAGLAPAALPRIIRPLRDY